MPLEPDFRMADIEMPQKVMGSFDVGRRNAMADLAARRQAEIQGMQLQQAKTQMADAETLRRMHQESGGDVNVLHQKLLERGMVNEAASLEKHLAQQKQLEAQQAVEATIPPEQQNIFRMNPQAYVEKYMKPTPAETPSDRLAREKFEWEKKKPTSDKLIAVIGPDGRPQYVPSSQAAGMQPYEKQKVLAASPEQKIQASLSSQQVLDQAETLFKHAGRSAGTGATSFLGSIPGTEAKGFQANLETFKSQTFLPMVSALKGMGALSDAEGKKITASVGALDPDMPEKEFEESLKKTTKFLFEKAQAAGLDVTLPDFVVGTEPSAHPEDIANILNKYK